ncbi:dystroglycan isoform X6 [Drosophila pseudoobscura]|uniref:Dystroglycan 1 n=1 Tax=Drosophila pseudoobscura pseudoobscura TaxID=46245 RepID=A0A6I8VVV4_DROPS|nr:dystroglycan isoform X6 [Drosophila pseudoobscura]
MRLSRCLSVSGDRLLLLLAATLAIALVQAERDFNVNDSQVPVIEPKDVPAYKQDPYVTELMGCQNQQNEIVLSLLLKKHDWSELTATKRAHVQAKLAKFFAIPKEFISLDSVSKRELRSMHKLAMRKGGKGNKNIETLNRRLGRASFMIGCGPSYFVMGEPIAKQIAHQVKDGTIGALTEENFGLWFIWRKELKSRSHRRRRQSEGSGADDDDYEYEDEGEEAIEPSTEVPAVTTHAHRHHHGVQPNANDFELSSFPPIEDVEDATTIPTTAAAAGATTARTSSSSEIDSHVVESTATHRTISSKEGEADAISTPNNNSSGSGSGNNEQLFPGSSVPPSTVATTTPASPEATSTVSTFSSTDYVEPQPENSVPIIKTRLQKLAVTSGKAFTMIVPEDTFWDAEDQGNLRLELTDKDGHELKSNSWLQFNADKRELYGLPLDDTVSRWQYRLSATDSGNATVTETVEISVQQHRAVRTINHEISILVKINEKHGHNIDWQLKLINALARTLDDDSSSAVVVREIRQTPQDPHSAIFVYFNETLPTSDCPEKELSDLVSRLDAQRLSDLVQPLLGIKSITGQLIGSCQKDLTKVKPTMQMAKNVPPMPRNQVDRVNASVGQLLVFKVPPDTFYDANDNDLTLTLKSKEHKELSTRHWLQFDSKNQEFYGIPKSGDTGSEEYLLVAEDSGGLSAHDALVVVVSHPPKKEFGAFFKAYLAIRHENFNAELQRKFVERIARVNGDATTNQIQIRSINIHHDSDGTIVNFYNTSLYKHHNRCPEKELAATRSVYLVGDSLRDSVKRALGPELNLTNFSVAPFGSCHHAENIDITNEFVPTRTEEPSQKSTFSEEYLANFILPAVIILVMIVLASIVACCLHRRRHKSGKMELGDEEERKSFRAKGIPVIFQDEYEEKPEIGNKSPVILKDEKPPLLPPSYNTSNMNGDNDVDEYVPPPAVVVGGREVRGKSPATPSYRKPPPYVSP